MKPRPFTLLIAALTLLALAAIGIHLVMHRSIDSRHGPVHRFPLPPAESFLTDARAAAIAREVMTRDGYPAADWTLAPDDRTKAPDGRPDQFLVRNADNPNRGFVTFHCPTSPTPQRGVTLERRDREITAQGWLGKYPVRPSRAWRATRLTSKSKNLPRSHPRKRGSLRANPPTRATPPVIGRHR